MWPASVATARGASTAWDLDALAAIEGDHKPCRRTDAQGDLLRFWDAASGRPLWIMPAHKSLLVGIRVEGDDIVTRGFR